MVIGERWLGENYLPGNGKDLSFNSQNPCRCWTQWKYMHSQGSYGAMACRDSRISRNARANETDLQWKTIKKSCLKEGEVGRLPPEVVHSPWHTHAVTHGLSSPCLPPTLRSEKPHCLQHIREFQRQETSVRISETFMGEGNWNSESQVPSCTSALALHPHVVQTELCSVPHEVPSSALH